MDSDYSMCRHYSTEQGDLLDVAFIDRGALWDRTRRFEGAEISFSGESTAWPRPYFVHPDNEQWYLQPGHPPIPFDAKIEDHEYEVVHGRLKESDVTHLLSLEEAAREEREELREMQPCEYLSPSSDAAGPDGAGEDPRVKNPQDLENCLTAVVSHLSSLDVFRWSCTVMCMPLGVLEALKKAPGLTTLHLDLISERFTTHARECPQISVCISS